MTLDRGCNQSGGAPMTDCLGSQARICGASAPQAQERICGACGSALENTLVVRIAKKVGLDCRGHLSLNPIHYRKKRANFFWVAQLRGVVRNAKSWLDSFSNGYDSRESKPICPDYFFT